MEPVIAIAVGIFLFLSFTTALLVLFACSLSGQINKVEEVRPTDVRS